MLEIFCQYNNWANALLLDAFIANADKLPASSVLMFSHILNAQSIWLSRIDATTTSMGVWQPHDLATCRTLLEETATDLTKAAQMEKLETSTIKYTTATGVRLETSAADILLHVFNHGTYHRAQIAKEMRQHDIEPVSTDYIQFVRSKKHV